MLGQTHSRVKLRASYVSAQHVSLLPITDVNYAKSPVRIYRSANRRGLQYSWHNDVRDVRVGPLSAFDRPSWQTVAVRQVLAGDSDTYQHDWCYIDNSKWCVASRGRTQHYWRCVVLVGFSDKPRNRQPDPDVVLTSTRCHKNAHCLRLWFWRVSVDCRNFWHMHNYEFATTKSLNNAS